MNYGMKFVTLYRRQGSRPPPWKRNAKKQNGCLRGLTNNCEKKGSKNQRRKGKIYPFECRVPKNSKERDKKAFLSNQCKEIEENNRMANNLETQKSLAETSLKGD